MSEMKKIEELKEKDQAIERPMMIAAETGVTSKVHNHLKKFIYLASLAGMGLFLNSCMAGYVGSEPVYVEYSRPERPSNLHIWIDGDWGWNNQTHVYVQRAGYWEKPRQGRSYVKGSWQTTPKGKSWSRGHWQKDNGNRKNHNR
jgi:hypothetical protein